MFSPSIVVQKHSSGGSIYGDSSISGDFAPPVHGGNSLLRVAAGCDGGGGGGSSSSLKSWAQQTEETYQLQLALALRLSSEAASVDDPNSLDLIPDDSSSSRLSSSRSAESISHRFWVNGCLSYSDKIPDGFYLIHGMDPYIWNMCTDLQDNGRIPSIDLLKSLDPRNESAFEVVVIDRRTDSKLKEMQNIVHSITFNCLSRDAVVDQLAQLVCNHMGVSASTREDEFVPIWKKISDGLKYCLGSVVLPIGSLSTGLCRHRALLFKVLADTIDLPCRIAKGCKYCNRHDATSCLVQFGSNREYLIDLIGKPGCKSEPDSLLNGPYSISISSPLHFPRFRPVETAINFRSLAEHYFSDCQSLNRVFKGPSSGAIVEQPGLELLDWNSPIHSKINNEVSHPFTRPRNSHLYESSSAQQNRRVPNVMNRIVPTVFFPAGRLRGTEKYYTGANGNAFNSQFESSQLVSSRPSSEVSLDMNDLVISWSDLVVRDRIGAGSFGTVHRAEWNRSEVAVKILMEQDFHPERREEFLREVSIMNRLRHPNIVLLMGAITEPPKLAIVTEYLSRGNLFKLLHKSGVGKVLDERRRLSMAYDVASGMNYLHRRSPPIVHRDLKSPNLLVAKNYTVKVGDFGLSRLKANTFLSSKTAAGTPEWMAPEVLRAELSNEKSDVYSFGVILWELATLHQPWSNLNPFQVVALVAYEGKRLEIPHNVNPQVATLIKACWADDPQARPPFSEIMDSLQSLLDAPAPQPGHGHSQYRT